VRGHGNWQVNFYYICLLVSSAILPSLHFISKVIKSEKLIDCCSL
jgi:hypothetical protein